MQNSQNNLKILYNQHDNYRQKHSLDLAIMNYILIIIVITKNDYIIIILIIIYIYIIHSLRIIIINSNINKYLLIEKIVSCI